LKLNPVNFLSFGKIQALLDKQQIIKNVSTLLQEVPTSMEIVIDDEKREQRFHYLAKYMVEKAIEKDALIVSDDGKGIAILFRTNSKDKNFWKDLIMDIKLAINVTGIKKGLNAMKIQSYVKNQRPKEGDYLYCWFWGIMADARGSDDSKTAYNMKNQFYAISQDLQLPIYAETRIRRISLAYRRYGFELFNEWDHPSGGKMYFLRYFPPAKN
jgi:hypothetical protein